MDERPGMRSVVLRVVAVPLKLPTSCFGDVMLPAEHRCSIARDTKRAGPLPMHSGKMSAGPA